MADENQQPTQDDGANTTDNSVTEEQKTEEIQAPAELSEGASEAVAEQSEATAETQTETDEEDFDINKWYQDRYQPGSVIEPDKQGTEPEASFADRLSSLNADEQGTVSPEEAARVFEEEWNRREQRILSQVDQRVLGYDNEKQELQAVVNKYPQVKSNPALFELIADKRDASAIRGGNGSLLDAAEKVMSLQKETRSDATQKAQRTQQIQASAHLETSGVTGDSGVQRKAELRELAGSPNQVKGAEARRALLKSMMEDGQIQLPQ